jgi:hypothetical protein
LVLAQGGDDDKLTAEAYFSEGERQFAAGEFLAAAASFYNAYRVAPHPAVLVNIAVSYDQAGRVLEAVESYRRYLTEMGQSAVEESVRARLAELEKKVGDINVTCSVSPCEVSVNGVPRGGAPVTVVVLPGTNAVEANGEGVAPSRDEVFVSAGQRLDLRLTLAPIGNGEAPRSEEERTGRESPDGEVRLGVPFWVASGITLAAGVVTVVFGVRTIKDMEKFEDSERSDENLKDQGERDKLVTNVMIGVTSAAAVTALGFAIYDIRHSETASDETARLEIGPGPGLGLGAALRF